MASVNFTRDSAEISGEARGELDRIAKSLNSLKTVEVRAYATGPDPADARKVALARALAVRSYLIDQGVKIRIEVGAFASEARGVGSDRVDVITPGG
jgi:outer membrane protein OmpA-like peptidoglycan-associated protein